MDYHHQYVSLCSWQQHTAKYQMFTLEELNQMSETHTHTHSDVHIRSMHMVLSLMYLCEWLLKWQPDLNSFMYLDKWIIFMFLTGNYYYHLQQQLSYLDITLSVFFSLFNKACHHFCHMAYIWISETWCTVEVERSVSPLVIQQKNVICFLNWSQEKSSQEGMVFKVSNFSKETVYWIILIWV